MFVFLDVILIYVFKIDDFVPPFISPVKLITSLTNVVPSHYKVKQKQTNLAQLELRSQSALLKCQQAHKQWKNLGGRT